MESLDYFYTGGTMFDIIPIIVTLIFIIVFATIITSIVKGISEWSNNNKQPVLDINCKVVSKRNHTSVSAAHNDTNGNFIPSSRSTSYYVTFEFESKDRMEFKVTISQYGMLAEGDLWKLKFQGTRLLDFTRQ